MKLWAGRFRKPTAADTEEFNASIQFDYRLWREDIDGSLAHVNMLAAAGILSETEANKITGGLNEIGAEIEQGQFKFSSDREDIHMHIEQRLIEKIGPLGGKVHIARSRNDHVALDTHLYVRRQTGKVLGQITTLQHTLICFAETHLDIIMPGYTHLQHAQPILLAHHLLAYVHMLQRDRQRFMGCLERADMMPLGAGALAGTSFPIDQQLVADKLGFSRLYENSLDAVSDRDYILEFLAAAAICMVHLSRLAEELILWSSQEFGFIELDDAYSTGSSIMPQKKNPDILELIRGKTGRVAGHLVALLVTMKGLPLAYNKDMQEDKEGLFDTVDTLTACLAIMAAMIPTIKVNRSRMRQAVSGDFSTATDLADYLARRGLPFRQAHVVIGKLVQFCLDQNKVLEELSLEELQRVSPLFKPDVLEFLRPEAAVAARTSYGGTAPEQVRQQLARLKKTIALDRKPSQPQ